MSLMRRSDRSLSTRASMRISANTKSSRVLKNGRHGSALGGGLKNWRLWPYSSKGCVSGGRLLFGWYSVVISSVVTPSEGPAVCAAEGGVGSRVESKDNQCQLLGKIRLRRT